MSFISLLHVSASTRSPCTHVQQVVTEFAVLVCLCTYIPDDDLVQVETHSRNISDKFVRSEAVQLYLVISDKTSSGSFANYKQFGAGCAVRRKN
jgi:cytidine deaminase